ncbi:BAI1-associated protein 3 isoform X2 [Syngnathoides biaculeatus]|uniref:BAI1-associated protein 3 isoform X2 n=1 Tax=Syngnathoides biaculeatus TaxID=300417 RepID=UPI002ADD9310|nr:BAI1-associated protein 3 isoform X2 [Syngnathoides biaculeatus]
MTTLLDLKSSVLRQVQRSQSLRTRRESPPAAGSPLGHCPEPLARRISEESMEFFERMNTILQKQESMLQAGQAECQRGACTVPPPQEHVDQAFIHDRISRTELDLIYEEVVYTVVNRVGVPSSEHVTSDEELFAYLRKVFDMGEEEHDIILQKVQESKRATFSLRASVLKAKNLLAKDANGYSDPYCMLGILEGQSPRESEEKKERKFSFRKRKDKLEKRSSTKEALPARCIQVTEVKPETLNPVWDEHFVFEVDDVHSDLLHLDIWDHDDDVSVAEACKKLNEVSGLRGMGRYFKQIAKSVRANGSSSSGSEENADDFLGCINISLNEIPVGGFDTWFKLEPRSSASKVQGECHLILKLFTSQRDTTLSKKESNLSIHKKLLCKIVEHEHAHVKREPYNWNGQVSPPAWTVLTHHAVQTDLTRLQQAIIRWQCYSGHHRTQRVCYSLLLRLLRAIDAEWDPPSVRGDLERQLSDSFRLYTEHCLCLMKNMRQVFPCTSAAAVTRYELMLRGIGYMQNMRAFKSVCPLRNELHLDITSAVKKGTSEWYESLIAQYKPEDGSLEEQLKKMVVVVDAVCADMQRAQNIYNKLFYSAVKVDFFSVTYRQLEKLVADDVNVAMERLCGTLEQESSRLTQTMGETVFELFVSLKSLKGFREFLPLKDAKMLALTVFHNWFKSSIHKFLQIVHDRSCDRICKAVDTDKMEALQQAKHSSSALEVTSCFRQVRDIWLQLAWPDSAGAFIFVTRLTDNFCSEAVYYSEMLTRKIERSQLSRDHKSFIVQTCFFSFDLLCASTLSFSLSLPLSFFLFFPPSALLLLLLASRLAVRGPQRRGARTRLPGSPAPRPGLARGGARHGGVVRRRGQGAGVQGAQRAAFQHGPGPAEGSQAPPRDAHGQDGPRIAALHPAHQLVSRLHPQRRRRGPPHEVPAGHGGHPRGHVAEGQPHPGSAEPVGAAPAHDPGLGHREPRRSGGVLQPLPVHGGDLIAIPSRKRSVP